MRSAYATIVTLNRHRSGGGAAVSCAGAGTLKLTAAATYTTSTTTINGGTCSSRRLKRLVSTGAIAVRTGTLFLDNSANNNTHVP